MQKYLKNHVIADTYLIASNSDLNYHNIKTRNNNAIISVIAIKNSEKHHITSISIAKIKTIVNPLIAKILIAKSIKIISKLNKILIYHNYLDNSLVDK